jgi:hypothetical protein
MGFRIPEQTNDARVDYLARALALAFDGNKAAMGRRLGYKDGSFVGQLLRKEKPITEVTEARVLDLHEVRAIRHLLDGEKPQVAHDLSYTPDTVPYLSREELMTGKDLPTAFKIDLPDDAMGAKAPRGTRATFEQREPEWGDAVLLFDAKGAPHVRVYRQSLEHAWEGHAPNPNFATFHSSMPGVRVVAVLESLGGGWAQLSR